LEIASNREDAHSGVDGGAVDEPMSAMIRLLAAVGTLSLPGFYDGVMEETAEEQQVYRAVAAAAGLSEKSLESKWRQPTFSVANILTSGAANNTIIPRQVTANVSFRLVPNQVRSLGSL
jgi:di- and tripeptidase